MRFIKESSTVTNIHNSEMNLMMPVIFFSPEENIDRLRASKIKRDTYIRMLKSNSAMETFDYSVPSRVNVFIRMYRKLLK